MTLPTDMPLRIPVLGEGWKEQGQVLHTGIKTNVNTPSTRHGGPGHLASRLGQFLPPYVSQAEVLIGLVQKQGGGRKVGASLNSATDKLGDLSQLFLALVFPSAPGTGEQSLPTALPALTFFLCSCTFYP